MIIGFAGRKRSGKTTLANLLKNEENAVIITIADYLKHLCCELMNITYKDLVEKKDNGYTFDIVPDEKWFRIINEKTNIGIENIKKELDGKHILNIRQLLQVIGTDVIRKYDENWHVNQMIKEFENHPDELIVVDDVRFPNEREAILKRSGKVFFIIRTDVSEISNHSSETALKWQDFDKKYIILNDNISLDKLIANFKVYYKNGFNCIVDNSIFLNENEKYIHCGNFGFNYDKNDSLLSDILRQIREDNLFNKFGFIRYTTRSKKLAKRYKEEVDNRIKSIVDYYTNPYGYKFVTRNPLIVENLKIYL